MSDIAQPARAWRPILCVLAHVRESVDKAAPYDADTVQLDLFGRVAPQLKSAVGAVLADSVRQPQANRLGMLVRVNWPLTLLVSGIERRRCAVAPTRYH